MLGDVGMRDAGDAGLPMRFNRGAILKPAGRVRVLGAALVPDRRGLRWAGPLAGWERAKEKPRRVRAGPGGGGADLSGDALYPQP